MLNEYVINSLLSFKNSNFSQYQKCQNTVLKKFGNIKESKEAYYAFRNWFNETYFNKENDLIEEGFYFHMLMNSCINSLVRIGANGMNQSYGARNYSLSEFDFYEVHKRLEKSTIILWKSYEEILEKYDSEKSLMFLDPPYFARINVGYEKTKNWDLELFLKKIQELKAKIIYTDIECEHHKNFHWHQESSKDLKNISPQRKEESSNEEVFFSNFIPKSINKILTTSIF